MEGPEWGAVVVAAGRGTRMGRPKQLLEIAGKPMLEWSLERLAAIDGVADLAIATEPDWIERVEALAAECASGCSIRVVAGGATRQESVRRGLAALPARARFILVHDGARPLVRSEDVRRAMAAVAPGIGALLATPVVDTIKQIDESGAVLRTFERARLCAAQTPQLATADDLRRAHREAELRGLEATDDAALLEAAGVRVIAIEGDPENFKVTLPGDLERAEAILRKRAQLR